MAFSHQRAEPLDIVGAQRLGGCQRAGVLRDDVVGTPVDERVQFIAGSLQLRQIDITQCLDAEVGSRGFALLAAGVVLTAHQPALHLRVDDHHPQLVGDGGRLGLQAAAVDEQRMPVLAQCRDELIHDAATAADELVLGLLAQQRDVAQAGIEPEGRLQRLAHGHFQRSRRAEACTLRHVAADHHIQPMGQRAETLDEDIDDAADVVGPALVTVLGTCISSELVALVVIVGSHDPDAIVGTRRDGDFGGEVDGAGQHETVVVVGVLADQVDTTRCADDVGGCGVQFLLQQGGCVLDGVGGGLAGAHDRKEVGCGGVMPGVSGACRDEPVVSCGMLAMKASGNLARK